VCVCAQEGKLQQERETRADSLSRAGIQGFQKRNSLSARPNGLKLNYFCID